MISHSCLYDFIRFSHDLILFSCDFVQFSYFFETAWGPPQVNPPRTSPRRWLRTPPPPTPLYCTWTPCTWVQAGKGRTNPSDIPIPECAQAYIIRKAPIWIPLGRLQIYAAYILRARSWRASMVPTCNAQSSRPKPLESILRHRTWISASC